MTRLGKILVCATTVVLLSLLAPLPAGAVSDQWASWAPITGTSNNYELRMQQRAAGFPEAAVASDSRSNVQLPSGATSFLGPGTPPGAKYGTSQGSPYLSLRPKVDNATSPSTTTYTFDRATPDTGWAFVLGDIDADQVQVRALDAGGAPVPAAEIDTWFQGAFNYAGGIDLPTWNATTSTLVGNPSATDTDGAAGWFEPDTRLRSLTFVFTRRAGFPVYQTWFVSRARPLGGMVDDVTTAGSCPVQDSVLALVSPWGEELATTSPDATGAYDLGEFATQSGYTVRLSAPTGCAVVGPAAATVDNRADDGTPGSRADFEVRQIIPQPISGTVTDTDGNPVPGVIVTLTRPDSSTVTRTTRPDGGYLFDDNPIANGYTLELTLPDGYAPGPGGTDITGIDVDATAITDQDFVIRALPAITGQVTGGGNGLGGVPVTLTPAGGGPSLTTVTSGDGTYLFAHVEPGNYTLTVDPPEGYTGDTSRDAAMTTADLPDQDFALTRPGAASGEVTDDDGGVQGVEVEVDGPGPPTTITTNEAGTYFADNLDPGTYTTTISPPDGYGVVGDATLTFTITSAGEIRGGLDFKLATTPPAPTPTPTATSSPTAQPTASPAPPPPGSAGPDAGADNDGLPDTGGPPAYLLVLGGALLAGGAALVASSRRQPKRQPSPRRDRTPRADHPEFQA